jgi:hypothetical protein
VVDPWTPHADNQSGFFGVPGDIVDGVGGYDGKGDYSYIWTATLTRPSVFELSIYF